MKGRNRGVPAGPKLGEPFEERSGLETGRADHARSARQAGKEPGDEAMRMEERQNVEQAVPRLKPQDRARVMSREACARMRQGDHFRPRGRARSQEDEGVVGARREILGGEAMRQAAWRVTCCEPATRRER